MFKNCIKIAKKLNDILSLTHFPCKNILSAGAFINICAYNKLFQNLPLVFGIFIIRSHLFKSYRLILLLKLFIIPLEKQINSSKFKFNKPINFLDTLMIIAFNKILCLSDHNMMEGMLNKDNG